MPRAPAVTGLLRKRKPWQVINNMRARENPFRTERLLELSYRFEGTTWDELLCRCERLGYRAAIVGPHGSGKTTLIEGLAVQLRSKGYGVEFVRLDEEEPSFTPGVVSMLAARLGSNDILLFDGAEQLNPLAWTCFRLRMRRLAGLIVTTHEPGRLPTLWKCRTSPALLAEIASELLEANPEELRCRARDLFSKHEGNLRDALWEWYDLAAEGIIASGRTRLPGSFAPEFRSSVRC